MVAGSDGIKISDFSDLPKLSADELTLKLFVLVRWVQGKRVKYRFVVFFSS